MNSTLHDLLRHQSWSDAEHWRAISHHAAARADEAIRNRLHHIHMVQRLFVWAVGDRNTDFSPGTPADFKTFEELRSFAFDSDRIVDDCLQNLDQAQLVKPVTFSWFKDPPLTISASEALTQCAMHSQWHRGQNAARLRELGGEPPTVDLIVWYWRGRPAADWGNTAAR
jgi:uncharacterized damage-inducible protein DinB